MPPPGNKKNFNQKHLSLQHVRSDPESVTSSSKSCDEHLSSLALQQPQTPHASSPFLPPSYPLPPAPEIQATPHGKQHISAWQGTMRRHSWCGSNLGLIQTPFFHILPLILLFYVQIFFSLQLWPPLWFGSIAR